MPRNLFDMLLLVASVLGLGALAAWTALQSPARADRLEALLQAGAERALIEKGFAWAEVSVSGQTATLTGTAPSMGQKNQAHDAIVASARTPLPGWVRRYAGGDLPAGGLFWGGITHIRDLSVVTDVISPYLLRADTVSGTLILSGYIVTEEDRDALFMAAETAFPGQVEAELVLAPGAPEADWLAMAEFALGVLAEMEMGAIEVRDTDVTVSGLVIDEETLAALEARLAEAPAGFTVASEFAIGTAPEPEPAETGTVDEDEAETEAETPAPVTETRAPPRETVSRPDPAPASTPAPAPAQTETETETAAETAPDPAPDEDTAAPDAAPEAEEDTTPAESEPEPIDPYELEARLRERQAAEGDPAPVSETPADPDTLDDEDGEPPAEADAETSPAETPEEN